jgi:MoxR-like ATPase
LDTTTSTGETPAVLLDRAAANVERVVIGKRREVDLALAALIARGHVLIEDVPGVGKTVLAKALARSFGGTFKRIQFTPDLLPSDVTGVSVYNQRSEQFEFRPGPIFGNVVLADEINRATPKTQSALLEAMEERQVSADGQTYQLDEPFVVMATQNPIEYEGTFPLPEAQLDRFLIRLTLGYPGRADELAILDRAAVATDGRHPVESLPCVVEIEDLRLLQAAARGVYVDPHVREYVVAIVSATRDHPEIYLGASPRGSLALFHLAQAWALVRGRDYVLPDDVKALAEPAIAHRLILAPGARVKNVSARVIVAELLARLPVPGAAVRR